MNFRCLSGCLAAGAVLAAAIFGGIKRQTYTDIAGEQDYLKQLQVAEIPEKIAISACEKLLEELPECDIILRIEAIGEIEHIFGTSRQKVCVKEVYSGDGIEKGSEIYLTSQLWSLIVMDGDKCIERGFVNILNIGEEYLVFISQRIETGNDDDFVYELYSDSFIAPVFSCEKRENVVIPVTDVTYVPYTDVENNEFFAVSETAVKAWEQLKASMLEKY